MIFFQVKKYADALLLLSLFPGKRFNIEKKCMKTQSESACASKEKGISQWIIKKTIRTSKNKAISGCTAYLQAQPAARPQERLT